MSSLKSRDQEIFYATTVATVKIPMYVCHSETLCARLKRSGWKESKPDLLLLIRHLLGKIQLKSMESQVALGKDSLNEL